MNTVTSIDTPANTDGGRRLPDRVVVVHGWGATLTGALGTPDETTWVVAHSLGAVTTLRALASLPGPLRLGVEATVVVGAGHFLADDGVTRLPLVLDLLRSAGSRRDAAS